MPRLGPTDGAPAVDGALDVEAYNRGWQLTRIFYQPSFLSPPSRVRLVASASDLHIFIDGVSVGVGPQQRSVSVAFDINHDGGALPGTDDVRFIVNENGSRSFERGNGAAWVAAAAPSWDSATAFIHDFAYNVEMRIPLSSLGGGDRFEIIGMAIRVHSLRSPGDDFFWPPHSTANAPRTWADLLWLRPPAATVELDTARITQGLEYDAVARSPYDMIAGKQTLVRAQAFTTGFNQHPSWVDAVVTRISPRLDPPQSFRLPVTSPFLPRLPRGRLDGSNVYNFYIPGSAFREPGTYKFQLHVSLGSVVHVVNLGTRIYKPTADFNVLLLPMNLDGVVPDGMVWSDAHTAAIPAAMRELERMMPVRDGIATFNFETPPNAGIRYFFWPFSLRASGDLGAMDVRGRTVGNQLLHLLNRGLERRDRSNLLGRIDRICVLGASSSTGGGQAQFGWSPYTAGAGFDSNTRGASATVVAQELLHCLDRQVLPESPNHDGGGHTRNNVIPVLFDRPVVNMIDRRNVPGAASMLFWLVGASPTAFIDGWEWNYTRQFLLDRPRLPVKSDDEPIDGKIFRFTGILNTKNELTPVMPESLTEILIGLSQPSPNSLYRLNFYNGQNIIASLPFDVSFESTFHEDPLKHGHGMYEAPEATGIQIKTALPDNATGADIRYIDDILWSKNFSNNAPIIAQIAAEVQGDGSVLTWETSDPDGDDCVHNIYFHADEEAEPILLETGFAGNKFEFPLSLAPASPGAFFLIRASDGFNITDGTSNTFEIPERAPFVTIVAPNPELDQPEGALEDIVQNQPIILQASSFDLTDGVLDGDQLKWSSDKDGTLGTGNLLPAQFPTAGPHELTVLATNSFGLTATHTVQIVVMPDTDGDGIPDEVEEKWPCYDPEGYDSNWDYDNDGLMPHTEMLLGTDPCNPDSDGDGYGDSEEYDAGSDPTDPQFIPEPPSLFIPKDHIHIEDCEKGGHTIKIETADNQLGWSAVADVEWLTLVYDGAGDGDILLEVNCKDLAPGENRATLYIQPEKEGSTQTVEITVTGKGIGQGVLMY